MDSKAQLILEGKTYEFPTMIGSENEKAFDISKLRSDSTYVTFDNGFANTGVCTSAITYLDGEKGILRYRGYPIEQIAEQSNFLETTYLLLNGELPKKDQLKKFKSRFKGKYALPKNILKFFDGYPKDGHPMGILSSIICSLSAYYPEFNKNNLKDDEMEELTAHLMAKILTIAAASFKKSLGKKVVAPKDNLDYVANFLHMMFSTSGKEYKINKTIVNALDSLLVLHADHEQNCSTSTVRLVGSSQANPFASISGGICALWGPLHGGANQKVVEMLQEIQAAGGNVEKFVAKAKEPNSNSRLMGFGHRVYKNFDPRCTIIKKHCYELFEKLHINDPLLDIAKKLEEIALKDEYFVKRKLYPNVDFYSGLIYKAIGITVPMFTVMFAIGRMPGWISQWKEMKNDATTKIGRPRQIYTGKTTRNYIPIDQR